MYCKSVLLVALALYSSAIACPQCGCGNPFNPQCLPAPNPYDALSAALALPLPLPPPPALPYLEPLGPILPGCGPAPSPVQIIQAPPVTVPGPCSPVIQLPAPCLPPPQIIAHKCVVSKSVCKPQVYQRLVQIPTVARFLKKSFAPIIENIAYTATPKCGPEAPVSILPAPAPVCAPPPPPPCACLPPPPPPPCACPSPCYF